MLLRISIKTFCEYVWKFCGTSESVLRGYAVFTLVDEVVGDVVGVWASAGNAVKRKRIKEKITGRSFLIEKIRDSIAHFSMRKAHKKIKHI